MRDNIGSPTMDSHQPMAILASDTSLVLESCVIRKVYEVRELRVKTEVNASKCGFGAEPQPPQNLQFSGFQGRDLQPVGGDRREVSKNVRIDLNWNSTDPTA